MGYLGFIKHPQECVATGLVHFWCIFLGTKKTSNFRCSFSAEREGFEPPVPLSTAVFKTAVIDHSTTFPVLYVGVPFQKRCKGIGIF